MRYHCYATVSFILSENARDTIVVFLTDELVGYEAKRCNWLLVLVYR